MVSLIVHFAVGIAFIVAMVLSNPQIFRQPVSGPKMSLLEVVYYIAGIAATVLGFYFNIRYMNEYAPGGTTNPFWGEHGSLREFIVLGYANPAASNASEDYTIMSLILLPLFILVDAHRRGVRRAWLLLPLLFTVSSSFPWAFYLAIVERQRRVKAVDPSEPASLPT
jgi:Terpene cyclase DEP1